ncbi:MAG: right-handed parallel beta-helix repeat-containing protein [Pseudonocardiaceae bacterium]
MVTGILLAACQASPEATGSGLATNSASAPAGRAGPAGVATSGPIAVVCGHQVPGLATAPAGAVVVDPAVEGDLSVKTEASPPGTTFWLAPGRHVLGGGEFDQVAPKEGNRYLGGPGAVLDGRGLNRYAFTGKASDVTISDLTIRGFVAPANEGVVNHDSGNGWVIERNTIEENRGAGLMAGARQQLRGNCVRNNGQYGMNAFQDGDGIVGLVVEGNEITGNNTDDWESRVEGCGCTGGIKFWAVNGADVRGNWVHDNRGPGLWADTNNNDFVIENNLIENNDGEAVFYETSYNLILRGNTIRKNTWVTGKAFADQGDNFPVGAVYLSEAGGEPRVPARTDKIDIYDNVFDNNWSGITAWENADRFCNSEANTSTGYCTRLVSSPTTCSTPAINTPPLYHDCRWKTQRLDIHDNIFTYTPEIIGCSNAMAGRMAVLSNYGTSPNWSPYKERVVQQAIAFNQHNIWRNNTYHGLWTFVGYETGSGVSPTKWQAEPYQQDAGSTFSDDASGQRC